MKQHAQKFRIKIVVENNKSSGLQFTSYELQQKFLFIWWSIGVFFNESGAKNAMRLMIENAEYKAQSPEYIYPNQNEQNR